MIINMQIWDSTGNWLGSASCSSPEVAIRFGTLMISQGCKATFEVSAPFVEGTITEGQILDLQGLIDFHEREKAVKTQ